MMNENSLYHLLEKTAFAHPKKTAYLNKADGEWRKVSWEKTFRLATETAKALMALGVDKNDKVAILSRTCLKWTLCDFGILSAGAVTVGIYPSNLADECAHVINHSGASVLFVENAEQLAKIHAVRDDLPSLKHIILLDGDPDRLGKELSWDTFIKQGLSVTDAAFLARTEKISQGDLATIVYTSGTTGVAKGVMLTHRNLLFAGWSAEQSLHLIPGGLTLQFLPLAHVMARIIQFSCLRATVIIAFAQSMETIPQDLKETNPHFFASPPRLFEKMEQKIQSGAQTAGGLKKAIFDWALQTGYARSRRLRAREKLPVFLRAKYRIAHMLVFKKIHAALGGRLHYAVSGAAPLSITSAEFFHACGILVLEGLGMTENSSFSNVNRIANYKFGTVGQPGPGIEQMCADDGEILFRGKNVMAGYYNNEAATRETIDADGWLHTGDIGSIDDEGFVTVTDRKKDLIITAGGKNIAPQRIEGIMRTSTFISQFVCLGDARPYLIGLLTLNRPEVEAWAVKNNIQFETWEEVLHSKAVQQLIDEEIAKGNTELASFETIKRFAVLPEDFTVESGHLTPTLKVKRKAITETHAALIESVYARTT